MSVKAPFADVYMNLDWLLDVLQSESLLLLLIAEPVLLGVASTSDGQGNNGVKFSSLMNLASLCHSMMAGFEFGDDQESDLLMTQFERWIVMVGVLSWSGEASTDTAGPHSTSSKAT
jgi:hypothetical protein